MLKIKQIEYSYFQRHITLKNSHFLSTFKASARLVRYLAEGRSKQCRVTFTKKFPSSFMLTISCQRWQGAFC